MSTVSNSTLASRFKALLGVKAVPPAPAVERSVVTKPEMVKVLILGNSDVGKSQFVDRLCGPQQFGLFSTIGIDFRLKEVDVLGKQKKLQIWDTAGQERFHTITSAYYRGAHTAILLYEVGDQQSFMNLRNYINNILMHAPDGIKIILIGKCNNPQNRIVAPEEGKALADEFGIPFLECAEDFDDSFVDLLQTVLFSEEFDEAAREAHEAREARKARGAAIVEVLTSDRKEIIPHWFKKDKVIVQPPMLIKDLANIVASYDEESMV